MALQLKLLVIGVFLLLTTLSFCQAKNSTVKVVGLMHCTDCIKNQSSSSHASLGFDVFIICKARKSSETTTQGNGAVDKQGKFNVTLSDPSSIDGCYAKLQSNSSAPCPIQGAQTASVKIQSNNVTKIVMNRPTVIEFSPITCQSAFFWPFLNLTFFASPPPPPPQPQNLPPLASPVQPPLPPPPAPTPQPSYDPPAPEIGAPSSPPPAFNSGTAPPTYQNLPTPTTSPQAPPPLPVCTDPSPPLPSPLNSPIQSPTPPKSQNQTPPPTPALSPPTPALSPPSLPPPAAGIATPPSRRRPNPIPRAPPIPRLPLTPSVPRKYFNAPKSKSKPPRYD